jgi:hypothetical protein
MSDSSKDDLLVAMLDLEDSGVTLELMSRVLAVMTGLGWAPEDSTDTWRHAVGTGSIRYNAWNQPTLSSFGRATAIAIKEERTLALWKARRLAEDADKHNGHSDTSPESQN